MRSHRVLPLIVAGLVAASASPSVTAATVSWTGPTTFTTGVGDSAVLNTGTFVSAQNYGGTTQVINGVTFTGVTTTTDNTDGSNTFGGFFPIAGYTTAMTNLMTTGVHRAPPASVTATLGGLTIGRTYRAQAFAVDARGGAAGATQSVSPGGPSWLIGQSLPSYVVGTFTADATTQTFSVTRTSANGQPTLQGYALFDISPNILVTGNAVTIADGDATPSPADFTDFGVTTVGSPVTRIFRVDNTGFTSLAVSGLTLPTGYSIVEGLSASIAAGSFDTFTVQLDAAIAGVYSGDINFTTGDPDIGTFNYAINANVIPAPVAIPSPASLPAGLVALGVLAARRRR